MTALLVDGSNYANVPLTTNVIDALVAAGAVGFIAQSNMPPSQYPPSQTAEQLRRVIEDGRLIPLWYLFWWAGVTADYYARQMEPLSGFEGKLAIGFGDFEDTSVGQLRFSHPEASLGLPPAHSRRIARQARPEAKWYKRNALTLSLGSGGLVDDVLETLELVRQFPTKTNRAGVYSGPWYWGPYLGNPQIAQPDRPWWPAEYDGIWDPNVVTAWGGWMPPAALKQVQGDAVIGPLSGIDTSIATDDFVAMLQQAMGGNVSDPADKQRIADLETMMHDVTDKPGEIQQALIGIAKATTSQKVKRGIGAVLGRLDTVNGEAFPS